MYGVDAKGKCVLQRTLTRSGVIRFFANLPECLVGMEACSSREDLFGFMRNSRSVSTGFFALLTCLVPW